MYNISTVGKYIDYLEKNLNINTNKFFFRGESKDYKDTSLTATLYRGKAITNTKGIKNGYKYNTWNRYLEASKEFYKSVPNISKRGYDNFVELCQHHSLPTFLLDVSISPLVALYFASKNNGKDGYVYIFNRNRFIPFSNKIFSYSYLKEMFNNNICPLDLGRYNNIKLIISSIKRLYFNINDSQRNYIRLLIKSTIKELISYLKFFYKKFSIKVTLNIIKTLNKENTYSKLSKYIMNGRTGINSNDPSALNRQYSIFLRTMGLNDFHNPYSILVSPANILGFLIILANHNYAHGNKMFVPDHLNLYADSTVNWNRIKAQSSKFIVQLPHIQFMNSKSCIKSNDKSIIVKPKYYSKIRVPSRDKHIIRKELDYMGINGMNLFLDKDHTAQYIKSKYYI